MLHSSRGFLFETKASCCAAKSLNANAKVGCGTIRRLDFLEAPLQEGDVRACRAGRAEDGLNMRWSRCEHGVRLGPELEGLGSQESHVGGSEIDNIRRLETSEMVSRLADRRRCGRRSSDLRKLALSFGKVSSVSLPHIALVWRRDWNRQNWI